MSACLFVVSETYEVNSQENTSSSSSGVNGLAQSTRCQFFNAPDPAFFLIINSFDEKF
jgi:hypothetical protein